MSPLEIQWTRNRSPLDVAWSDPIPGACSAAGSRPSWAFRSLSSPERWFLRWTWRTFPGTPLRFWYRTALAATRSLPTTKIAFCCWTAGYWNALDVYLLCNWSRKPFGRSYAGTGQTFQGPPLSRRRPFCLCVRLICLFHPKENVSTRKQYQVRSSEPYSLLHGREVSDRLGVLWLDVPLLSV